MLRNKLLLIIKDLFLFYLKHLYIYKTINTFYQPNYTLKIKPKMIITMIIATIHNIKIFDYYQLNFTFKL